MPLLLGVAAAVGLSLAVVFTPSPQQQPLTSEQTPYSWENIQAIFSSEDSVSAQNEGSTSVAGEGSAEASLDATLTLR
jgi:hypothetical protein